MPWLVVDLAEDPDELHYEDDPAELYDALGTLLDQIRPPAWHALAACRGQAIEVFFPTRGGTTDTAKAICARCPVIDECAASGAWQHANTDGGGIWAGQSAKGRHQPAQRHSAA